MSKATTPKSQLPKLSRRLGFDPDFVAVSDCSEKDSSKMVSFKIDNSAGNTLCFEAATPTGKLLEI